jgi:antitoxin (DNA-binding transcriptional repressor) of toxin-antitoxin stability system
MEATVLKAKNNLSQLLHKAEQGETVIIRRGRNGERFQIVPLKKNKRRTLTPAPQWKGRLTYTDEAVWESEWKVRE